jgi:hypothetical protein
MYKPGLSPFMHHSAFHLEAILPPQDISKFLESTLVVTVEGDVFQHLAGQSQGCYSTPYNA